MPGSIFQLLTHGLRCPSSPAISCVPSCSFPGLGALAAEKLFLRNQIMNVFSIPWIADVAFGREVADRIQIPTCSDDQYQ